MQLCLWPDSAKSDTGDQEQTGRPLGSPAKAVSQVGPQLILLKVLHEVLQGTLENRPGPAFMNKRCVCPTARKGLIPSGEMLMRASPPWHGHLLCLHLLIQQNFGRGFMYEALNQMLKTPRSQCKQRGRDIN